MSVQIAGSAKTGKSFYKNRDFIHGASDLDMGVIITWGSIHKENILCDFS